MDVVVDRIEGEYAVVEIKKGEMCNLPIELVPNVKEGDIVTITINKNKTEERKKTIEELMNSVFE